MPVDEKQPSRDEREALYNNRLTGPASKIQLPRECVTQLYGLMTDVDPQILKPNPWFPPAETPQLFLTGITPVLARHPILRNAEVRDTGRGLHLITYFITPVELRSARDQQSWTGCHQILNGSIPADPNAPALIGLTRPVGSINSKTGRPVRVLKLGTQIEAVVLQDWAEEVAAGPFEMIGEILFGEKRITPCPYCHKEGSYLDVKRVVGFCYGPCHKVPLKRIYEPFFIETPKAEAKEKKGGKSKASKQRLPCGSEKEEKLSPT